MGSMEDWLCLKLYSTHCLTERHGLLLKKITFLVSNCFGVYICNIHISVTFFIKVKELLNIIFGLMGEASYLTTVIICLRRPQLMSVVTQQLAYLMCLLTPAGSTTP